MSFLITDAMATASQSPAAQQEGSFSLIMVAAIFVLFYLMLIRPQNKRAKEHKELMNKLQKGDEIVTSGGILGKISSLDDQVIKVTIADGVEVCIQRGSVSSVLPKGTLKAL